MTLSQVLVSSGIFLLTLFISIVLTNHIDRTNVKRGLNAKRSILIKRSSNIIIWFIGVLLIAFVWGVNFANVWVIVTGIIAVIAIGFFAIWSLLSNLIAGIILFFSRNFEIGEKIEIFPEKIKGRIESIHSMFTVLKDDKGNYVNIPNNMLFQRIVKRYR